MKRALLFAAVLALGSSSARAADAYWDTNSGTPGAGGPVATGIWNVGNTNWSGDPTGASPTTTWVAGDTAVFSAGADATGAFTVNLGAPQTAGGMRVEEGTVSLAGSAVAIGTGTVTINSGATLSIPTVSQITQTAGSGGLVIDGGTFRQTNIGSGGSFWDADGSITVGASGAATIFYDDSNGAVLASSIYTPTGGNTIKGVGGTTINGGAGTLTKTGPDEFRFQGTGLPLTTFAKLVVNQGLYRLGSNASVADERGFGAQPLAPLADAITLTNGGAIGTSFNATLHVNRGITLGTGGGAFNNAGGTLTIPSAITGSGNLLKNSTGTLTLSGNNDYTGNTLVSAGTLSVQSATALGSTSGDTQVSSGAAVLFTTAAGSVTTAEPFQIAGTGGGNNGAIAISNGAAPTLSGTVTLSGDATITVSGTSAVTLSNAAAITSSANQNLILTGGAGAGGGTISGAVNLGAGSLTKNQGGTWRLNNATGNTYSGGTIINSGVLQANNTSGSATGSGTVTVSGGALAGTGSVSGPVTVAAAGSLAPGTSVGTLTLGGGVDLEGTLSIEYDDALSTPIDVAIVAFTFDIAGATLTLSDISTGAVGLSDSAYVFAKYNSLTGTFATVNNMPVGYGIDYAYNDGMSSNNIALVIIPEASAFLALGMAGLVAAGVKWRRRK